MELLISLLLMGLLLLYAARKVKAGIKRGNIAGNVVAACATFQTLDVFTKEKVIEKTAEIIRRSNWPEEDPITFPTDVARWGWYALAMRELSIKPVCAMGDWVMVSNPFTAMMVTDSMLDTVIKLAQKEGYRVEINREPGMFELMGIK